MKLLKKYDNHLDRAQHAMDTEKVDRATAKKVLVPSGTQLPRRKCSVDGVMEIRLDMGSTQPTPKLGGGVSHFNSQASTNSLYVVCASREPQCFAFYWESREGAGGPENIISAFVHFLENYNTGCTKLVIWADNTTKGTKSWVWLHLAQHLVRTGWFKSVDLKFYVKGHTYMPGYGPDACHNTFLKAAGQGDKCHVHDYLDAARTVRNGGWVVVHLKAAMHRAFRPFLAQWYKKGGTAAFDIREFQWFNVGEGEDRHGKTVCHDREIWARHSHMPERFYYVISVDKIRNLAKNPSLDWHDPQWWKQPKPLKMNAYIGIVKSMEVMDTRTREFWTVVLKRMFGSLSLKRQLFKAKNIDEDDDAISSNTDDDLEERIRKRGGRRRVYNKASRALGLVPQGQRA
jgi:hypothetical protein